jgi:glycerophosphoryl diester phosphodiesterase
MPTRAPDGRNVDRIGHRGAPRRFLENTLPSFAEALAQGADAIELDVHVTTDKVPVVHHDPGFSRRISPALLRGSALGSLTLSQIRSVDLGDEATVPTLEQVLDLAAGKATVYVEVKAGDIVPVVETIRQSQAICAIHSFDHAAVVEASHHGPGIPRGALLDRWPRSLADVVRMTECRDLWPKASLVTEERIDAIHQLGCRAIIWTVNDRAQGEEFMRWGVDALCTDDLTLFPAS